MDSKCEAQAPNNKRTQVLQKGIALTNGDRNVSYGSPHPNLKAFAELVQTYLRGQGQWVSLDATDGAVIMTLAKISRIAVNKDHEDNYVDGAVYMAIAAECAEVERRNNEPISDTTGGVPASAGLPDGAMYLKDLEKRNRAFIPLDEKDIAHKSALDQLSAVGDLELDEAYKALWSELLQDSSLQVNLKQMIKKRRRDRACIDNMFKSAEEAARGRA